MRRRLENRGFFVSLCLGAVAAVGACASEDDGRLTSADVADAAVDSTANANPSDPVPPIPHAAALAPSSPTGIDPSGAVDAGDATLTAIDAEAGADVDAAQPAPSGPPYCGNGKIDPGDECDPGP